MDAQKKEAMVVSGFCLGPGLGDAIPGQTVQLDPYTYGIEIDLGRVKEIPVATDPASIQAAAAAQAHQALLQKISVADSVLALEQLLSEDPEISAAYEKRLTELEDAAAHAEAQNIKAEIASASSEADACKLLEGAQTVSALLILKEEIPADEAELHAAIEKRLAELVPGA